MFENWGNAKRPEDIKALEAIYCNEYIPQFFNTNQWWHNSEDPGNTHQYSNFGEYFCQGSVGDMPNFCIIWPRRLVYVNGGHDKAYGVNWTQK